MGTRGRGVAAGLIAALLVIVLFQLLARDTGPGARPHVVLVLIDTLRADHTSLEDYRRDTTPGLRAIAEEGLTFRRHFANAPWTRPSVATILTGLLPPGHRAQWGDLSRSETGEIDLLPEGFDTLPEILQREGYSTHAFMTNPSVTRAFGYAQGFDRFEPLPATLEGDRRAVALTRAALDRAAGPIFAWCHLMAPHNYRAPASSPRFAHRQRTPITAEEPLGSILINRYEMYTREQAVEVYDRTLVFADALVTELVEHIRDRHPETLVVITSDHGEEFAEHGGYLHARTLYNELIRIPLILWGPGIPRGQTVDSLTSLVDLLPTILDYLGLPHSGTQGRSLLDLPRDASREVYAEKRNGREAIRALITEDGKLIETKPPGAPGRKPPMEGVGRWEFFTDPAGGDATDAVDGVPTELLDRTRRRFEEIWNESQRIFEERAESGSGSVRGTLSEEDARMLRELGYVE